MDLTYDLWGRGWATATIRSGTDEVRVDASYLSDPLRELAEAALRLSGDSTEATATFLNEPGAHRLTLRRGDEDRLAFEVRWIDGRAGGANAADVGCVVLAGETTVRRFRHQVTNVLWRLDEAPGPDGYREQWGADFPAEAYARLRGA